MATLFSRIIAGEIPGAFVDRSPHWVAFLDIHPAAPGHTLLVSTAEAPRLEDLPEDALDQLGPALARIIPALKRATGAPAVNLVVNDGAAAGQEVPHVHVHLIPRHPGDGKRFSPGGGQVATAAELTAMAGRIAAQVVHP